MIRLYRLKLVDWLIRKIINQSTINKLDSGGSHAVVDGIRWCGGTSMGRLKAYFEDGLI
jgi:hypothetical protein